MLTQTGRGLGVHGVASHLSAGGSAASTTARDAYDRRLPQRGWTWRHQEFSGVSAAPLRSQRRYSWRPPLAVTIVVLVLPSTAEACCMSARGVFWVGWRRSAAVWTVLAVV